MLYLLPESLQPPTHETHTGQHQEGFSQLGVEILALSPGNRSIDSVVDFSQSLCNMLRSLFTLFPFGLAAAPLTLATPFLKAAPYTDPRLNGGSMLDASAGLGEPLNVSGLQPPHTTVVVIKL